MKTKVLGLAAAAAMIAGCATITKGTTQAIAVNTPGAPGAECTPSSGAIGSRVVTTPATLTVEKSQEAITVHCRKECYHDGSAVIASNMETMTAGNLVLGGVIGLGVDAASGAMNKYASQTDVLMMPIQGCGRAAPLTRRRS
jgi:hypothetical protein